MRVIKIMFLILFIGLIGCQVGSNKLKFEDNFLRGLEMSNELDKPIFIHFTGYACMAYNEFDMDLTTSNLIRDKLNNDFVLVQLFVDDKAEIREVDTLGLHKINFPIGIKQRLKDVEILGEVNLLIEEELFDSHSQPLYVIMDSKRNVLVKPFYYTKRDRDFFLSKLDEGVQNFRKAR